MQSAPTAKQTQHTDVRPIGIAGLAIKAHTFRNDAMQIIPFATQVPRGIPHTANTNNCSAIEKCRNRFTLPSIGMEFFRANSGNHLIYCQQKCRNYRYRLGFGRSEWRRRGGGVTRCSCEFWFRMWLFFRPGCSFSRSYSLDCNSAFSVLYSKCK